MRLSHELPCAIHILNFSFLTHTQLELCVYLYPGAGSQWRGGCHRLPVPMCSPPSADDSQFARVLQSIA